ncbi:MAG TPA: tetratricopeptide repeat protein, partial [Chitinophagales bacterium]|nr:tetratricopeptide repeat protein [Chitinophagales bacterium]
MAKAKNAPQKPGPKAKPNKPSRLSGNAIAYIIIAALSILIYADTIPNSYNLDDELVTQNHRVTSKGWEVLKPDFSVFSNPVFKDSPVISKLKYFMPEVFRTPYYQDKAGYKYEYRPLVFVSFAIEHAIFSKTTFVQGKEVETDDPHISHIINTLLYALLCLLLFIVLRKMFSAYNILFPLLITLIFTAHPIHTEVVASIKNRDEILSLLCGLSALYLALNFSLRKWYYLFGVFMLLVLGILAKPTTITFALLIPLTVEMFSDIPFLGSMVLTLVLVVPAVFFARLYTVSQQIWLGLFLFAAVVFFHCLKRIKTYLPALQNYFTGLIQSIKLAASPTNELQEESPTPEILKRPLLLLPIIVLLLAISAVSVSGIMGARTVQTVIPLLLLAATYFWGPKWAKALVISPINLICLAAIIKFDNNFTVVELGLIVFLSTMFITGDKLQRRIVIGNYLAYAIVALFIKHTYSFLTVFLFIGFVEKRVMPVTLIVMLLTAGAFVKRLFGALHGNSLDLTALKFPMIYLFAFLFWRKNYKIAQLTGVLSVLVFVSVSFSVHSFQKGHSAETAFENLSYKLSTTKAVDPTPIQSSVRPLRYMEYPISPDDPFSLKLGTAMSIFGNYLRLVFIPYPMSYYYGYAYIKPVNVTQFVPLLVLIIHIALLGLALWFFNRKPVISYSIFFYLISISAYSNLAIPIPGLMGDRFLLVPSIGFSILATALLYIIFKFDYTNPKTEWNNTSTSFKITLVVILVLYSITAISRNLDWKDRITLFRHDISTVENSAQAQNLLAVHLIVASQDSTDQDARHRLLEESLPHFKKALDVYPDFLNASYDLARAYDALGMADEAYAQYKRTLEIDSTFTNPYF